MPKTTTKKKPTAATDRETDASPKPTAPPATSIPFAKQTPEQKAQTWKRVLELHSGGMTITAINRLPDCPGWSAVDAKADADPAWARAWARARMKYADALFDEAMDIAEGANVETFYADSVTKTGKKTRKIDVFAMKAAAARDRLRIDTRLRIIAKINPEKYGDALKIQHSGGLTLDGVDDDRLNAMVEKKLVDLGVVEMLRGWLAAEQVEAVLALFRVRALPTAPEIEGEPAVSIPPFEEKI